ncbi:MAG: leucine--tRNA ligase [Nitrososphaeria archaeon]
MNDSVEDAWVKRWEALGIFKAEVDKTKSKVFVTFPIPYMNGPLHLGHAFTASRVDSYAKYKKLNGFNVLYPQGWHWTGQPIVSAAERLAKGDEKMVREFKEIDKVPEEILEKFKDPVFMARYYTERNREAMKKLGLGIDWRREFVTTIYDQRFSSFIEWQFLTLRDKGYVTKGSHPVVWCPRDKSPVGDHDRLQGEGVFPVEFRLIFFKLKDEESYLVASTLRPETIFGVTNIWLSPDLTYVKARINGKLWIIGKSAVERLKDQLFEVEVISEIKGNELMGKKAIAPLVNKEIPILPASFIDPEIGTAVVYSVPAHAPYDYLALRDLQKSGYRDAQGINPISIIEVEGYGEFPAVEEVEKLRIKDQNDPNADIATRNIYSAEFRKGVLKQNCGDFAGLSVNAARKVVYEKLEELGLASSMWELPEPVICRCTARCHVKILQDQWFLKYSDERWKEAARECVRTMRIYPEEARQWFLDVIDWLNDYPCARQSGLGTPLPWDKNWLVETLSDSTVYMAYYTVGHRLKKYSHEQLKKELYDYVFFGKGDPSFIASVTGIPEDEVREMREEFLYWYPVDLRVSAKELVPNHLTFFIFHHVALFERNHWPKAIAVNGMLRVEGEKMSKSKGNVITLEEGIREFGADALRIALLSSSEYMDDANFKREYAVSIKERIAKILLDIDQDLKSSSKRDKNDYDIWLLNRASKVSKNIQENMEKMSVKLSVTEAFFIMDNAYKDYKKYVNSNINYTILKDFIKYWAIILAPFAPFTAEEMYQKVGEKDSVFLESWPSGIQYEEVKDVEIELVNRLVEDIKEVFKIVKKKPTQITVFVLSQSDSINFVDGKAGKDVLNKFMKIKVSMPDLLKNYIGKIEEKEVYEKHLDYIARQVGVPINIKTVSEASNEEAQRAKNALPFKPAFMLK